jgi:hypothetical protein
VSCCTRELKRLVGYATCASSQHILCRLPTARTHTFNLIFSCSLLKFYNHSAAIYSLDKTFINNISYLCVCSIALSFNQLHIGIIDNHIKTRQAKMSLLLVVLLKRRIMSYIRIKNMIFYVLFSSRFKSFPFSASFVAIHIKLQISIS